MKRGDVYKIKLITEKGSHVQNGYRPVIVISNKMHTKYAPTVTIIPSDNLNFETVNANSNQYKLTLDNKVDAFTADNAENGFSFAIGGSAVTSQEAPN